jgi:Tol biopolymer transport system component
MSSLFLRAASVLALLGAAAFGVADAAVANIQRVSVGMNGQGNGDLVDSPVLSSDGRYAAFSSAASDLIQSDTNGVSDVFVRDLQLGQTKRVSVASDGSEGIKNSYQPSLTADGRWVVFLSRAKLAPGATWDMPTQVYVHDCLTGETTLVSRDSDGHCAFNDCNKALITPDGSAIAFHSKAKNLASGVGHNYEDVFVFERQANALHRISAPPNGNTVVGVSAVLTSLSSEGRYIVFADGDLQGKTEVRRYDRSTQSVEKLALMPEGREPVFGAYTSAYLEAKNLLLIESFSDDYIPGDTNGAFDVFVYEQNTEGVERVSVSTEGVEGNGNSYGSSISKDGRFVVFTSEATNLVENDTNGVADAFVHDRLTGGTERLSVNSEHIEANGYTSTTSISDTGSRVALLSNASNLVSNDTNGFRDAFVVDYVPDRPPVARAGSDRILTTQTGTVTINLDASASSDADGDPLTFIWRIGTSVVAEGSNSTVSLPVGLHVLTLTAFDPVHLRSTDEFIAKVSLIPPSSPRNLVVSLPKPPQPGQSLLLQWSDRSPAELGFRIQRKNVSGVYVQCAQVGPDVTQFLDTNRTPGQRYEYRVCAYNAAGDSGFSNEAAATTLPLLAAPSGLTVTAASSTRITLAWTDNSTDEGGFQIERSTGSGAFAVIASVRANVTAFVNTGLAADTAYRYRLRAYRTTDFSTYLNSAPVRTFALPIAPTGLKATVVTSARINLVWTDRSGDESGFRIERKNGASSFVQIASVGANITTYGSGGLEESTAYTYRVRAYRGDDHSAYSNEATASTLALPAAPSGLTATPTSSTLIVLGWTDNSTEERGFKIERKSGSGAFAVIASVSANITSYANTGLTGNTAYTYRVRAYRTTDLSAFSNEATATTLP